MWDYSKQIYLITIMILITIIILITTLFMSPMVKSSYNSNYTSKHENRIFTEFNMFINSDKTPDEIARSSESDIIHSIELNALNKK